MSPGCHGNLDRDIVSGWGLPLLSADPTLVWLTEMTFSRQHPPPASPLHPGLPLPSLRSGQHCGQQSSSQGTGVSAL